VRITNDNGQTYTIPDKTRVLPKARLALVLADIGLYDRRMPREVILVYADGSKKLSTTGTVTATYVPPPIAINKPNEPMTLLGFGKGVSVATSGKNLSSTSVVANAIPAVLPSPLANPEVVMLSPTPKSDALGSVENVGTTSSSAKSSANVAVENSKKVQADSVHSAPKEMTPVEKATTPESTTTPQTAAGVQSVSGMPTWLLLIVGSMLLGTGVFASWVIGKNHS
jgi:hypothetical protein